MFNGLTLELSEGEFFDQGTQEFYQGKSFSLRLEHSLVSLSKWESRWKKPFLTNEDKTNEEIIDYIRCMTITQRVPKEVYTWITSKEIRIVSAYIEDSMTATTFSADEKKRNLNRETITSEIMYFWIIALDIPIEAQKWHLNRLLTLINVCNIKNQKPKPMTRQQILARNRALNAKRRAKLGSKG